MRDKLRAKAIGDDETLDAVLEALVGAGLLSDERFAASFVHVRFERGQGPLRIEAELRQRGVDVELSAAALAGSGGGWQALARRVRQKRFGAGVPGDYSERARQARFLHSRGFTAAQVRAAFGDDEQTD